jgi:hypothetical protein
VGALDCRDRDVLTDAVGILRRLLAEAGSTHTPAAGNVRTRNQE